jgi:disulfide bond formation protein DsbB
MEYGMQPLLALLTTRRYWLALLVLGLSLEAVALFYQHFLGDEPCQACIHTRIWVAAFTLVALVMSLVPRKAAFSSVAHTLVLICALGLLERSWFLYQLENGVATGSCEFFLGFPEWFALDRWFPFLFEVRNLCSFTPELILGISMAQGLIAVALSVGLLSVAGVFIALGRAP